MISRTTIDDAEILAHVARQSFFESHGHSADRQTVEAYANDKFNFDAIKNELAEAHNIYHLIYSDGQPAGYSKIVFNASHPNIEAKNVTKLDRIYLLEQFIEKKLGAQLLQFNIDLSKSMASQGCGCLCGWKIHGLLNFIKKQDSKLLDDMIFIFHPRTPTPITRCC